MPKQVFLANFKRLNQSNLVSLILDQEVEKQTNKVFVWNAFLQDKDDGVEDYADEDFRSKSPASESSLVGYEIAPGIGSVMPSNNEEATDGLKEMNIDVHSVETTTKKVNFSIFCSFLKFS